MKLSLRTSKLSPPALLYRAPGRRVFTHIGPIQLEVQPDGAIHAIAQDFDYTRTYVVEPEDAIEFAKAILIAAGEER